MSAPLLSIQGALFVGRVSPEKGIETLFRAWESLDIPLRIVGDGPMMGMVKEKASEVTTVALGRRNSRQVAEEMAQAAFLVMPSEWYEGFPMTIVEAFSQGLPVIASRLGGMAEIIEDNVTGLHFIPGNVEDLARKVRWANEHPEKMCRMGINARRIYAEKYSPETNYRQLMDIYGEATGESRCQRN